MKKNTCKEICPHCGSNQDTIYQRKPQCYCKNCNKYFIPGTVRSKYSANAALVFNTINRLLYPQNIKRLLDLNHFTKKILQSPKPTGDIKIKYQIVSNNDAPEETSEIFVDGNLKNSIILTKTGNGFIITRGLDVRQKIKFNDFNINTNSSGPIKRNYNDFEE